MQLRISELILVSFSIFSVFNSFVVQADFSSELSMQQDPPIEFFGLVEFASEHQIEQRDGEVEDEKISLATLEVGMHSDISEGTAVDALWAYEEDLGSMILDTMTVSMTHHSLPQLQGVLGKEYLPFGSFTTFQLNDTFGLALAETNQLFASAGYHEDHIVGEVYAYENEEGIVGKLGGRLGYHSEFLQLGFDYIDSLYDSPAYGIHGFWSIQQLTLIAEHIIVDHLEFNEQSHSDQFEIGYDLGGIIVAASYQVNQALKELELAKEKVSMVIHTQIHRMAHVGVEVWRQDGIASALAQLSIVL